MKILSANAAAGVDEELVVPAGSLLHLRDQQHPELQGAGAAPEFYTKQKEGEFWHLPTVYSP